MELLEPTQPTVTMATFRKFSDLYPETVVFSNDTHLKFSTRTMETLVKTGICYIEIPQELRAQETTLLRIVQAAMKFIKQTPEIAHENNSMSTNAKVFQKSSDTEDLFVIHSTKKHLIWSTFNDPRFLTWIMTNQPKLWEDLPKTGITIVDILEHIIYTRSQLAMSVVDKVCKSLSSDPQFEEIHSRLEEWTSAIGCRIYNNIDNQNGNQNKLDLLLPEVSTLLYFQQRSFQVKIGEEWVWVDPLENHYVLQTGASLSCLTCGVMKFPTCREYRDSSCKISKVSIYFKDGIDTVVPDGTVTNLFATTKQLLDHMSEDTEKAQEKVYSRIQKEITEELCKLLQNETDFMFKRLRKPTGGAQQRG